MMTPSKSKRKPLTPAQREYSNKQQLLTYRYRRELGLCTKCKTGKPKHGRAACEACLKKIREEYYQLKDAGTCTKCKKRKAVEGQDRCAHCIKLAKTGQKRRRAQNALDYRCKTCGGEIEYGRRGKKLCGTCVYFNQKANHRMRARRLAAGLCIRCGKNKSRARFQDCVPCAWKKKINRAKLQEARKTQAKSRG